MLAMQAELIVVAEQVAPATGTNMRVENMQGAAYDMFKNRMHEFLCGYLERYWYNSSTLPRGTTSILNLDLPEGLWGKVVPC